jgi:hypothetical protein
MTEKRGKIGRESGKSSDKYMSPSQPQTGDGKTTRNTFDKVQLDKPAKDSGK